tara:strand:+ start:2435 stop:3001 length:567 start_codon:yes stop_codon:yes gene_type:complete
MLNLFIFVSSVTSRTFFSAMGEMDPIDGRPSTLFTFTECMEAAASAHPFVRCKNVPVSITHTAPDIGMAFINNIDQHDIVIGKEIACGGFGRVYEGKLTLKSTSQKSQERGSGNMTGMSPNTRKTIPVAIKELQDVGNAIARHKFAEFRREATIMSFFDHPNIVGLFGITFLPFLMMVMEYIPFGNLR